MSEEEDFENLYKKWGGKPKQSDTKKYFLIAAVVLLGIIAISAAIYVGKDFINLGNSTTTTTTPEQTTTTVESETTTTLSPTTTLSDGSTTTIMVTTTTDGTTTTTDSGSPATTTTTIGAGLHCGNCSDCNDLISSAESGDTIYLDSRIVDQSGDCLEFDTVDGVTFDCQGNSIIGMPGESDTIGISLDQSSNNVINNCAVSEFWVGIHLLESDDNTVTRNTLISNGYAGIQLSYSNGNIVSKNTVDSNDFGVILVASNQTLVSQNTIDSNVHNGVSVSLSKENMLAENVIESNGAHGVHIEFSSNSTLNLNIICSNAEQDIDLGPESDFGNSGDENTCDNLNGWDDEGITGCTFAC